MDDVCNETPETTQADDQMEELRDAFAGCALTLEEQEIIFGLYS